MRILQVIPYFVPNRGGPFSVLHDLAISLVKKGHEVTILTTNFEQEASNQNPIEGVKIVTFPCLANIKMLLYSPGMNRWLKENIKYFEIVHIHEFRSYQNNLVLKYSRKNKIPYIVQAHGSAAIIGGRKGIKKAYDVIWGKRIIKWAHACIAVSPIEVPDYIELGSQKSKVKIIPNGLFINNCYQKKDLNSQFRKELGISENYKIILYLGRLNERKGIDTLIHAFTKIYAVRGDAVLVIAGPDDGFEQMLKTLASSSGVINSIIFTGFIKDRMAAYQGADILVYPSRHEIFGLVPFEALLCGAPIIVSNDSGCGLIVDKANCGLTVSPGDIDALSMAMKIALDDTARMKILVKNGKEYIERYLNWENLITEFETLYDKSINHNGM